MEKERMEQELLEIHLILENITQDMVDQLKATRQFNPMVSQVLFAVLMVAGKAPTPQNIRKEFDMDFIKELKLIRLDNLEPAIHK